MPSGKSRLERIKQSLKRARHKVKLDMESKVRFSRLLRSRNEEKEDEDDSYMEDEDSMLVEFQSSNVSVFACIVFDRNKDRMLML